MTATTRKPTEAQAAATVEYLYARNANFPTIEASGLIRVHGWGCKSAADNGVIILGRLHGDGTEASWTSGLGINTPYPEYRRTDWVEMACHGDPKNPDHWRATGRAWPVGTDINDIR